MSQEALYKEITNLERKVNLLIAEHSRLKEQIDYKDQENVTLKTKLETHESQLSSFQSKYTNDKIVGNTAVGKEDTEEMKKVLDGYINEIDKCIAHLGEA
ncbi:MAG: hypothetical protein GY816_19970 [Cytophagales bacterium]|nr:hypothetical protein [Cytophagales bacterium]